MTRAPAHLAIDLGAESGRAILGRFDGSRVTLEAVHRFPNRPVQLPDGLHWDALALFGETCASIAAASARGPVESVGIDAWGVDYGLLDRDGELLGNPFHYRDERTVGLLESALERVPRDVVYANTGVQFMRFNTLYQLLSMQASAQLETAQTLLMLPDLIGYWLTGERGIEETNASTTQLYDIAAHTWAWELIDRFALPRRLFGDLRRPGTTLGRLHPRVAVSGALPATLPVVTVASHDTAAAVVAVPAAGDDFAYISSGTWSLVGIELDQPEVGTHALHANFTNELGFGRRIRFLRNVMGLWLLQECRRAWERQGGCSEYERLIAEAAAAASGPLVDPDHEPFGSPGDLPARIREYCAATGQEPPSGEGETTRCILDSLACKYRLVLERLERVRGSRIDVVHVVGGGSRNELLCQLTADVTGRAVAAGPAEATALGNVLVQLYAHGRLGSLEEMREVARRSAEPTWYEPRAVERRRWDDRYGSFLELTQTESLPAGGLVST